MPQRGVVADLVVADLAVGDSGADLPAEVSAAVLALGDSPVQQYWYRCGNPEGYYPYVRNCNTGWEQVPATPQNIPGPPGAPPPPPR